MKTKRNSIRLLALAAAASFAALLAPAALHAQTIYVTSFSNNNVGSYNAATGATTPGYTAPSSGVSGPNGVAVSGNTLYVANFSSGSIGTYNATTGATINANFAALTQVQGLTISGNNLYAASANGTVDDFNPATGAAVVGFTPFTLSGQAAATAVLGGILFVSNGISNTVGEYNATTGATINASFISGLNNASGLALSGNNLFVANRNGSNISEYNAITGALMSANFASGVSGPIGIAVSGNNLYAVSGGSNLVYDFNATTGAPITSGFTSPSGLNGAQSIAVVPEPSTWMALLGGLGILVAFRRVRGARRA